MPAARKPRRLSEREAARRARQAAVAKGTPPAAASSPPPPDLAAVTAAMEANGTAQAAGGPAPGMPPLTMDQIPKEQQQALSGLLQRANAPAGAAKDDGKRNKKFVTLELELAELLTFPAGPALMAGDEFCGQHFATQGPLLAHQLTVYSESHPSTYDTLVWLARQGSLLVIATTVVGYLLPPAIHHGLPAPTSLRRHYGMPHPAPMEPHLEVA